MVFVCSWRVFRCLGTDLELEEVKVAIWRENLLPPHRGWGQAAPHVLPAEFASPDTTCWWSVFIREQGFFWSLWSGFSCRESQADWKYSKLGVPGDTPGQSFPCWLSWCHCPEIISGSLSSFVNWWEIQLFAPAEFSTDLVARGSSELRPRNDRKVEAPENQ